MFRGILLILEDFTIICSLEKYSKHNIFKIREISLCCAGLFGRTQRTERRM